MAEAPFQFAHEIMDTDLEGRLWAQTAMADLDRDGRDEFILGLRPPKSLMARSVALSYG